MSVSCSSSNCSPTLCLHPSHSVTAVVVAATVKHYRQLDLVLSHEAAGHRMRNEMPGGKG